MSVGYALFVKSKNLSPDNTSLVGLEKLPCTSTNSAEIKNEKFKKTTESVTAQLVEKNDIKTIESLKEIVTDYFAVENPSNIIITHQTEMHAQGEFGQKWWLAFNDKEDGWKIISTGCSYINCHEINGYDFPSEMVPVCWDTSSNQLINQ